MRTLAAAVTVVLLAYAAPALAAGRAVAIPSLMAAPDVRAGAAGAAWRSGSALVVEAARYIGSGKFTAQPGAWCADAVSFWLTRIGKRPLPSRMAGSALAYGPHVAEPQPGDLVVLRSGRGPAGHVGVVVAAHGDAVEIISGNWSHRVARSVVSRRSVIAFVMT